MRGQEEHLFSLPVALILLLIFIAIFITITFILTPHITGGWISWLLGSLYKWIGVP
jgi:hypothetical protein